MNFKYKDVIRGITLNHFRIKKNCKFVFAFNSLLIDMKTDFKLNYVGTEHKHNG